MVHNQVHIRPAADPDVEAIADIHRKAFPNLFLARFGAGLTRRFFRHFLSLEATIMWVAVRDSDLIGFIAGDTKKENVYGSFMVRFFWPNLVSIIMWCLIRPQNTLVAARYFLDKHLMSGKITISAAAPELSHIAVEKAFRKSGVGRKLVEALQTDLADRGISNCDVIVDSNNEMAVKFYQRMRFCKAARFRQYNRDCILMKWNSSEHEQ